MRQRCVDYDKDKQATHVLEEKLSHHANDRYWYQVSFEQFEYSGNGV